MHGMIQSRFDKSLALLDAVLSLGELLPVMARKLSLGQRLRADLAAALIHEPSARRSNPCFRLCCHLPRGQTQV